MKKMFFSTLLCFAVVSVMGGCKAASTAEEADTGGEVTIDNYNITTEYAAVPERIVSLSYSETEILVALGLEDKIVGIAEADNGIDVVSDEYKDTISELNMLASMEEGGVPSLEVVLSSEPDFVYGAVYSFIGDIGVADAEDFIDNGINIYVSTSTYKSGSTIEDTYEDIRNIGKIFHVEDRAEEVVSSMQAEINEAVEKVPDEEKKKVLIYDSGESAATVYFKDSYESSLVELAGGVNVFADENGARGGQISWEAIVEENPDVIVINDWSGGEGAATIEEKIEFLKSLPELQNVTAIAENNFVDVPLAYVLSGNLQNSKVIDDLIKGIYPEIED